MIHSDWHIHSEASYDASLLLKEIADGAKKFGFKSFGITDHANLNDEQFLGDLKKSVDAVTEFQKENPQVVLGVELTPIAKPEFTYMQKHHNLEGYVAPVSSELYDIELACTKEELIAMGVRYAIGASHWRVDIPNGRRAVPDRDACIKEWYRQQMWLAADERVTILGHPWYNGKGLWYEDFAVVPYSMKMDVAEVLKAHGKYAA
jgi:histidinol phosphatase-like PHP family hydrolase